MTYLDAAAAPTAQRATSGQAEPAKAADHAAVAVLALAVPEAAALLPRHAVNHHHHLAAFAAAPSPPAPQAPSSPESHQSPTHQVPQA